MTEALRQGGFRLTPQCLVVLSILADNRQHPSLEQIYQQLRRQFPTTSLATIYNTVTLLKEFGQVLELGFADWGSCYDSHRLDFFGLCLACQKGRKV